MHPMDIQWTMDSVGSVSLTQPLDSRRITFGKHLRMCPGGECAECVVAKKVTSIERIEPLQEKAKKTLKELKVTNVNFKLDDANNLDDQEYDAILSAAAPLEVPNNLKKRLKIGGKLILPVGDSNSQVLTLVKRVTKNEFIEEKLEDVLFVPLLKGVVS